LAVRRLVLVVVVCAVAFFATVATSVKGAEWLPNGGFESGADGWAISSGGSLACGEYEGLGALGVPAGAGAHPTRVQKQVSGDLPAGTYTLSGWTRVQSGSAQIQLATLAFNRQNVPPGVGFVGEPIVSGSEYTAFSFTATVNFEPDSILILFEVATDSAGVVCFDNLSLTSEAQAPIPTTSPTATTTPPATATETTAPSPTSSPPAPTPTPSPTATTGPSFTFINGGFEDGLTGWSKYGGELTTTSNARGGGSAGLLTSNTESTKWAYQAVAIDASQHYEFSAHLQADGGVAETYLRVSWYPTTDASGSAMATNDSPARVAGPSGGFVYLTTGAVQPPAGALTARVRVLLAPMGGGAASIQIDDAYFGVTAAPSPTPLPTQTQAPSATGTSTPPAPLSNPLIATPGRDGVVGPVSSAEGSTGNGSSPDAFAVAPRAAATTTAAEGEAARSQEGPVPRRQPPQSPDSLVAPRESESEVPWPWLAGVALVVVGLAGLWLQHRQATR
jgi:carbohydrate binding protein with CBM4/9 domain